MKKLMTLFVAMFCLIQAQATAPVKQWGQLQVKGAQLCDQNGRPVVLRGVSLGWHNIWPRFYNKQAVKWLINDWHANIIRAAMGIQIEDNYLENPQFAEKCITTVVDAAIKNGAYVIIDWHAHKMHTEEAKAFFGRMAQKYGKYPNVLYELYNEPVDDSWESLKTYAKTIIDEIRQYDPDNIILMGCPHWDQDIRPRCSESYRGREQCDVYPALLCSHPQRLSARQVRGSCQGRPTCLCIRMCGHGSLRQRTFGT